jgi:hypothetical protein
MDAAIITAVAAVSGSIVGGLASFATTYFTQRNQAHRDFLSRDVAHREDLYAQFIKETTNLYVDSLDKPLTHQAGRQRYGAGGCGKGRGQHYRFL